MLRSLTLLSVPNFCKVTGLNAQQFWALQSPSYHHLIPSFLCLVHSMANHSRTICLKRLHSFLVTIYCTVGIHTKYSYNHQSNSVLFVGFMCFRNKTLFEWKIGYWSGLGTIELNHNKNNLKIETNKPYWTKRKLLTTTKLMDEKKNLNFGPLWKVVANVFSK